MRSDEGINNIFIGIIISYYWQKLCYISLNLQICERKTIKNLTVLTDKKNLTLLTDMKNSKINYLLFIIYLFY